MNKNYQNYQNLKKKTFGRQERLPGPGSGVCPKEALFPVPGERQNNFIESWSRAFSILYNTAQQHDVHMNP